MSPETVVSIVTPSFQSGRFIERTIKSVLTQDYPHIEYIVMDGGSTDETLSILKRYRGRLQYVSAPDNGAADAINRGFLKSTGAIFGWLNADDYYLPGAVRAAVRQLEADPEAVVVYGEALWIDEQNRELGRYPTVTPYRPDMWRHECSICQPAAFIRHDAFAGVGMLDRNLHFAFDYDLWIRLAAAGRFTAIPDTLAASRMHAASKTLGGRRLVFEENIAVLQKHFHYVPVNWVYGYLSFLRDGRDQYLAPLRHSPALYLASLVMGSRYNYRHLWRYWREWASRITPTTFRKLLSSNQSS
ncbi:MAG TPA: glycosyltransferase family 2 protein [Bryobacteraceae bacterium]|jgi:glycosyltransferase involved in cell wall biosynthesis